MPKTWTVSVFVLAIIVTTYISPQSAMAADRTYCFGGYFEIILDENSGNHTWRAPMMRINAHQGINLSGYIPGGNHVEIQDILNTPLSPNPLNISSNFTLSTTYPHLSGTLTAHDPVFGWTRVIHVVGSSGACPSYDGPPIPGIIGATVHPPGKIADISKFRSDYGHDYSDAYESCRSKKHYLLPTAFDDRNNWIPIQPGRFKTPAGLVEGRVVQRSHEGGGTDPDREDQVVFLDFGEGFMVVWHHVDLPFNFVLGQPIPATGLVGTARVRDRANGSCDGTFTCDFDLALYVNTPQGYRYDSFFEWAHGSVMMLWTGSISGVPGVPNFDMTNWSNQILISETDADAANYDCNGILGGNFIHPGASGPGAWLNGRNTNP